MRSRTLQAALLTGLTALSLLCRCSLEPVVDGGGTHTGNPDITACAQALFALLDNDSAWRVETYLDSGLLDPAAIIPPPAATALGRRAALPAPTAADSLIYYERRVLLPDTHFVNDTLIFDSLSSKTLFSVSDGDTSWYTVDSLHRDSVIVSDTFITYDTLLIRDTLRVTPDSLNTVTDTPASVTIIQGPRYDTTTYIPGDSSMQIILRDSKESSLITLPNTSFTVSVLSAITALSKVYRQQDATVVSLRYDDLNGDQQLFGAPAGQTPLARLRRSAEKAAERVELTASIDAGSDGSFATVHDNRIRSLSRLSISGTDTTEQLSYQADTTGDSIWLVQVRIRPTTEIFHSETRYRLVPGSATPAAAGDRLLRVDQTIVFARGPVGRLKLSLFSADFSNDQNPFPSTPGFTATVTAADGMTSTMSGTADAVSGITATYEADTTSAAVRVRPDGLATVEPR